MAPAPLSHARFTWNQQRIHLILVHSYNTSEEGIALADSMGRAAVPYCVGHNNACDVFSCTSLAGSLAANEANHFHRCAVQLLEVLGITLTVSAHSSVLAAALRDGHRQRPAGLRATVLVVSQVDHRRLAQHDEILAARLSASGVTRAA